MRTLLENFDSLTIGDCISEVYQSGKCGCCCALNVFFGSRGLRRAKTRGYGGYVDNRVKDRTDKAQEDT